jgi:hypothetical protein
MKKLLVLIALAGLGIAAYKHFEYHRGLNAEAWASATDPYA